MKIKIYYKMYPLESRINSELVSLKDLCWQNSHLLPERVETYFVRVQEYKSLGYNVRIHELITRFFYEKLKTKEILNLSRH